MCATNQIEAGVSTFVDKYSPALEFKGILVWRCTIDRGSGFPLKMTEGCHEDGNIPTNDVVDLSSRLVNVTCMTWS